MSADLFCPKHGPYDASLGSCPYCAQEAGTGRPPNPSPLSDDELPTDPFGARYSGSRPVNDDEEPTAPPVRGGGRSASREEDETEMPARRGRAGAEDDELEHTVVDREDTTLMGWLVVKHSPYLRRGHMWKIKPGAVWGRDPRKADIIIDDDKISGLHLRINIKDNHFELRDLGSVNGTWVNGEEASSAIALKQDDEIKMGDTVLVLKTLQ